MPERLLAPEGTPAVIEEFTSGGATLVSEDFGVGDHPIVLLHGIGMGRSVYIDLVSRLSGRIIGLDLPGFGEAPEPERTLTMERHADLVAAFLRDRGITDAVIIGHSMGAQIAAEVAARHPDVVSGLVLAGPTVNSASRSIRAQAGYLLFDLLHERPVVLWRGAREYLRGGPHLLRKMRATIVHDAKRAYGRVRHPVLVLRGQRDPLAPMSWCREIVDNIPGARFEEIPDHGHGTLISDSWAAAELIRRFVAEL
ncbi:MULTISPECIES: alpha/beta fold hydrolase [Microbacterium]|uniref:alpha/beta fold hydrolase n=1 Tax=Microbacterium TaxID=33882 RepID=UPI00217D967E|nr:MULTISPECIES: alpha/beta hydrolase [Microbacterium]UWF77574.1 alpha/beta hydrolase [Microbacterium neungamense]WCM55745.1 alpha/beta hydrolase [Microbacterium sp. EF45047]